MLKFAKIIDNETGLVEVGIGTNQRFYASIGMQRMDVQKSDIDNNWYLTDKCPMKTDEQIAEEEQTRILELSMTRSDFFDGMIKAFGLDSDDLLTVITAILSASQMPAIEQKVAINNYKNALNFYRKHPLFTILSDVAIPITSTATITITSKQWDKFFDETDKGNENAYKYLTTATLTINPTPSNAAVSINGELTSSLTLPFGDIVKYSVTLDGYLTQTGMVELIENTTLDIELNQEADLRRAELRR